MATSCRNPLISRSFTLVTISILKNLRSQHTILNNCSTYGLGILFRLWDDGLPDIFLAFVNAFRTTPLTAVVLRFLSLFDPRALLRRRLSRILFLVSIFPNNLLFFFFFTESSCSIVFPEYQDQKLNTSKIMLVSITNDTEADQTLALPKHNICPICISITLEKYKSLYGISKTGNLRKKL